jgi:hypothetical protein
MSLGQAPPGPSARSPRSRRSLVSDEIGLDVQSTLRRPEERHCPPTSTRHQPRTPTINQAAPGGRLRTATRQAPGSWEPRHRTNRLPGSCLGSRACSSPNLSPTSRCLIRRTAGLGRVSPAQADRASPVPTTGRRSRPARFSATSSHGSGLTGGAPFAANPGTVRADGTNRARAPGRVQQGRRGASSGSAPSPRWSSAS